MSAWVNFRFKLPMATRANNLVMPSRGRLVKTPAGREFKALARLELLHIARGRELLRGCVELEIWFHFRTIASDWDGPVKALQDAMKGLVFVDDRQVVMAIVRKRLLLPTEDAEYCVVQVSDVSRDPAHWLVQERLEAASRRPGRPRAKSAKATVKPFPNLKPAVYRPPSQKHGEPLPFGLPLTKVVR